MLLARGGSHIFLSPLYRVENCTIVIIELFVVLHYCKIGPRWTPSGCLRESHGRLTATFWHLTAGHLFPPLSLWSTPLDISNSKGRLFLYSLRWRLYIHLLLFYKKYCTQPSPFFSQSKGNPFWKLSSVGALYDTMSNPAPVVSSTRQHLKFTSSSNNEPFHNHTDVYYRADLFSRVRHWRSFHCWQRAAV